MTNTTLALEVAKDWLVHLIPDSPQVLLASIVVLALTTAFVFRLFNKTVAPWSGDGFRVDNRGWLVISSPRVARQFFNSVSESKLARRSDFGISWVIEGVLGQCMFAQTGRPYRRTSKLFHEFHAPSAAAQEAHRSLPIIREWVRSFRQKQQQQSNNAQHQPSEDDNAVVITAEDLIDLPFRLVCSSFYGAYADTNEWVMERLRYFCGEVDHLTAQVFATKEARCRHPFPTALKRRLWRFQSDWAAFNRTAMREIGGTGDTSCIVGALAADGNRKFESSGVEERELMDTLAEIVLANADFVGAAVGWPVAHLLQHPSYLTAIRRASRASVDAQTLNSKANGKDICESDRLLDAVIQESWRLEPMMLVTNPIVTTAPLTNEVGGHLFPVGTHVIFDTKSLNHDAKSWRDPDTFRPWRFLCRTAPKPDNFANHVFGIGKRRCLGQHLAKPLVRYIVRELVTQLELQPQYQPPTTGLVGPFEFPPVTFKVLGPASDVSPTTSASVAGSSTEGNNNSGDHDHMREKVLVFGCSGNVGRRLVPALDADSSISLCLAWHKTEPTHYRANTDPTVSPKQTATDSHSQSDACSHHQVDLSDKDSVANCLESAQPDRIVLMFPTLGDTPAMTKAFCGAFEEHQSKYQRSGKQVKQLLWVSDGDVDKFLKEKLRNFDYLDETHERMMALGSCVSLTRLEPAGFFQNAEMFYDLHKAIQAGRFASLVQPDAKVGWVDAWDIADAVYNALAGPSTAHAGKHYRLVSDFYSTRDLIREVSAWVRPVEVEVLASDELLVQHFVKNGTPPKLAGDRALVFRTYHEQHFLVLRADETDLRHLLKREPTKMVSYVARNAARWRRL